jgi:hypothetical protein
MDISRRRQQGLINQQSGGSDAPGRKTPIVQQRRIENFLIRPASHHNRPSSCHTLLLLLLSHHNRPTNPPPVQNRFDFQTRIGFVKMCRAAQCRILRLFYPVDGYWFSRLQVNEAIKKSFGSSVKMSIWPSESAATTRVPLPRSRRQPHQKAGRVKDERKDSFRIAEIFSLFAATATESRSSEK